MPLDYALKIKADFCFLLGSEIENFGNSDLKFSGSIYDINIDNLAK